MARPTRFGMFGGWMLCVVVLCAISVSGARAQAIDWLASQDGISFTRAPGTSRLDGMGGLSITIPDEANKLDLGIYGGNLSALLWDSDTRKWEFWNRSSSNFFDHYDSLGIRLPRLRNDTTEYGGRMSWRKPDQRLLGLEYSYDTLDRTQGPQDDSKVRGPSFGLLGAQKVGPLSLGAGLSLSSDNQDLTTSDVFAIRHSGSGLQFTGSLAYQGGSFGVGVQTIRQVNTIKGSSRDESRFLEDSFTWKRPIVAYEGVATWAPTEALRGAVRGRMEHIDGRQDVRISWSDRMPQNPGRRNLLLKVGTFSERVRSVEMGTRWELRPQESITLAAEGDILRSDTKVKEGFNFKGSRRAEDSKERVTRGGAGISYQIPSKRARVGVEGWYLRDSFENVLPGELSKVVGRSLELRTGVEYFVTNQIALRGGLDQSAVDTDLDAPDTFGIGDGFTFGAGYLPRGGLYRLDAAVRVSKVLPDYAGAERSETRRTFVSLGARFLL
jgi:hypothetical protein